MIQKRKCGNTDLKISVLGTGCWAFGGGVYWGSQNQKDVEKVVHASVEYGINYFDTAEAYNEGRSELSLGEAIKGISRDKIVIGSKVSTSNCYKKTLIEHCEASLKRLQTDYIDLYMIHWPIHHKSISHFTSNQHIVNYPPTIHEAIEALQSLKNEGKIRELGVSNFSPDRLLDMSSNEVAVNELPYNLFCRGIEFDTLPFCVKNGIGVIGYMALLQGILADIYPSLEDIPVWQRRTRHFSSYKNPNCRHDESGLENELEMALAKIRSLVVETGLTMPELAIKWILANPAITCSLVGSRNVDELHKNIAAVKEPIGTDIKSEMDKITNEIKDKLGHHFDYYESSINDRTR